MFVKQTIHHSSISFSDGCSGINATATRALSSCMKLKFAAAELYQWIQYRIVTELIDSIEIPNLCIYSIMFSGIGAVYFPVPIINVSIKSHEE